MSSTPLLSASGGLAGPNFMQDHPAFLRASHSPWRCIPQNVLVALRRLVLAYLIATGVMVTEYQVTAGAGASVWSPFFDFSIISYVLVFIYHLITFWWTFTHLYYPDPDDNEGVLESWIIRAMSLPRDMSSLRKQFHFTLFYTTTAVFSFMNSTIYWFITRQHDGGDGGGGEELLFAAAGTELFSGLGANSSTATMIPDAPFSDLFGGGWFKPFIIVSLHGATSFIMVLETLFLNSIKRPFALGSHFFGLVFVSGLYLAWAAVGKAVTGAYPFFWLDTEEVGSKEAVSIYCVGFVLLAPIMYTLMQGFTDIREGLLRPRESRAVVVQESLEA